MFATRYKFGMDAVGKTTVWKAGIELSADFPSRIPLMTSATTCGCLK